MRLSTYWTALLAAVTAHAQANSACPNGTEISQIVTQINESPITIDYFFTTDTDLVLGCDVTVSVIGAATQFNTLITVTGTTIATVVLTDPANSSPTNTGGRGGSSSGAGGSTDTPGSNDSTSTSDNDQVSTGSVTVGQTSISIVSTSSTTSTASSGIVTSSGGVDGTTVITTTSATSSVTTTSTAPATSSCIPESSLPTTCASGPPPGCSAVVSATGLISASAVLSCTDALGALADVPQIAVCLLADVLTGPEASECLDDAFEDICIDRLPSICLSLEAQDDEVVQADADLCLAALLPFLGGFPGIAECLSLTIGLEIVQCLTSDLGLAPIPSQTDLCPVTPPDPVTDSCLVVPQACLDLEGVIVIDLPAEVVGCTDALARAGIDTVDGVSECVGDTLGGGSGVVNCLMNLLSTQCIVTLPDQCSNLASLSGGTLSSSLPGCIDALGAYLTGAADYCLTSGVFTDGVDVVNCLVEALFV